MTQNYIGNLLPTVWFYNALSPTIYIWLFVADFSAQIFLRFYSITKHEIYNNKIYVALKDPYIKVLYIRPYNADMQTLMGFDVTYSIVLDDKTGVDNGYIY